MTRCLCPTPADNLLILVRIQLAELHHKVATLSLACCVMEPGHLLKWEWTTSPIDIHTFVPTAQQLISLSDDNRSTVLWAPSLMECGMVLMEKITRLTYLHTGHRHQPSKNGPVKNTCQGPNYGLNRNFSVFTRCYVLTKYK